MADAEAQEGDVSAAQWSGAHLKAPPQEAPREAEQADVAALLGELLRGDRLLRYARRHALAVVLPAHRQARLVLLVRVEPEIKPKRLGLIHGGALAAGRAHGPQPRDRLPAGRRAPAGSFRRLLASKIIANWTCCYDKTK